MSDTIGTVPRLIFDSIKKARQQALACDYGTALTFYKGIEGQIDQYILDLVIADGNRAPVVEKWRLLKDKLNAERGAVEEVIREREAFASAGAAVRLDREAAAAQHNSPPQLDSYGATPQRNNAAAPQPARVRPPFRVDDDPDPAPVVPRGPIRRDPDFVLRRQPGSGVQAVPSGEVNQALYGDRDRFGPGYAGPPDGDFAPAMGFGVPPPLPQRKPQPAVRRDVTPAQRKPAPTAAPSQPVPAPSAAAGGDQPKSRKPAVPKFSAKKAENGGAEGGGKNSRPRYTPRPGEEDLVQAIESEMTDPASIRVSFDDIAGQADAKQALIESVVYPVQMPDFHQGILRPPRGILLYGPPGTGKSMLAKAVATMGGTTFFNVSQATLTSKLRGDSEKLVRVLFEVAAHYAPSVVFIDEIDSICTQRTADQNEASRRTLGVLLAQMDGVGKDDKHVIVLGATNHPWDIDDAMRRRLEKRIYVPLPNADESVQMFQILTRTLNVHPDVNFEQLAQKCVEMRFSGADQAILIREAGMQIPRRFMSDPAYQQLMKTDIQAAQKQLKETPVRMEDFLQALRKVPSSIGGDTVARFEQWKGQYEM